MVNEVELKCETSLVAERPETRQHFFYFFTFFGSAWKGAPPRKGARFHVFTVVCSFSRCRGIDARCSVALRVCLARTGGTRCLECVGPATAGRLCRLIFAPSANPFAIVPPALRAATTNDRS